MKRIASRRGLTVSLALAAAPAAAAQTPVIVQEAYEDEISRSVEAHGTLRADESVTLTANVTETITALHFDDGDRVERGDRLVELRSGPQGAALAAAEAELDEARSRYERTARLVEEGSVARATHEQHRRDHRRARARVRELSAQLEQRVIRAPFAGVVGLREVSVGALVRPGDPLLTLDDDRRMKLDFSVPETRMSLVATGRAIEASTRARPEHTFEGEVRGMDSRVDPVSRAITVRAVLDNPEALLRPGQHMTVRLRGPGRRAVLVAEEAVVARGTDHFVYVVVDDDAGAEVEERQVTLGLRRVGEVEVAEGLSPGDRVVTHGTHRVSPGEPIRIRAVQSGDEPLEALLDEAENGRTE